ncbi:MAG: DUF2079 domain-containing protein [Anaerolineae bacterium]|nr:DUF2079 domain-containing protein [Anaerolineae bacterium]
MTHRRSLHRILLATVAAAALVYSAFFTWLSIERHQALMTHTADLGQMDLAVWNTLHGRFVQEVKGESISTRLTDHVEPVFWPVSVIFGLWDDARALLTLQATVIGLSAMAVWAAVALGWRRQPRGLVYAAATWAALAYLLAPQTQAATVADFHASPLAVLPLALLVYLGRRRLTAPALVTALAALAVKEEIALMVGAAGLYLALASRWRPGFLIAAAAGAWFVVATLVIIPHYGAQCYGEARFPYLARYDAPDQGEVSEPPSRSLFRTMVGRVFERERLLYVGGLLVAFAGAPLLAPEVAVVASPLIAANVLSQYEAQYSGEFHYSTPFMSVLAIAAGVGAIRALSWARSRRAPVRLALLVPLVGLPLAYQVAEGFTPLGPEFALHRPPAQARSATLLHSFRYLIPEGAGLSVTPALHPHFSHRERIYTFPDVADAEYVLLDVAGTTDMHPVDFRHRFDELLRQGYGVVNADDGIVLLERGTASLGLPDRFFAFARASSPPAHPLEVTFGTTLRLLGYEWVDDPKWSYTSLRLYWQALAPPPANLMPYAILFDRLGRPVTDTRSALFVEPLWYPVQRWSPGEIVVTTTVAAPLGDAWGAYVGVVVDGDYDDVAARLAPDEQGVGAIPETNLVRLPPVERTSRLRRYQIVPLLLSPPAAGPADVVFSSWLKLEGARLSAPVIYPGCSLDLVTYWSKLGEPTSELALSVRLTDAAGETVTQTDGPIEGGLYPARHWATGETVPDVKSLAVPADLPPGPYSVVLVPYDRLSGAPLEADQAAVPLLLAPVTVATGGSSP